MAKRTIIGEDGKEYTVKEKKPIYKRTWFLVIVGLIVIGSIGNQMSGGNKTAATEAVQQTTAAAAPATTEAKTEAAYGIGDVAEAGTISVVVNNAEERESFESDNQFIDDVTTDGKFIAVEATISNNDKEAKTFHSSMFKIVDDQGREFQTLTDMNLMLILDKQNLFLESVNPGMSRTGVFVFEVPADVESYSLEVSGGMFSGKKVLVKLK